MVYFKKPPFPRYHLFFFFCRHGASPLLPAKSNPLPATLPFIKAVFERGPIDRKNFKIEKNFKIFPIYPINHRPPTDD